jgi:hypothetical protein
VAVAGHCYLKRFENSFQFRLVEVNGKPQLTFADFDAVGSPYGESSVER